MLVFLTIQKSSICFQQIACKTCLEFITFVNKQQIILEKIYKSKNFAGISRKPIFK